MHAEHAELIATLRRENQYLNAQLADRGDMQAIIEAQDKLLKVADSIIRTQNEAIDAARNELAQCRLLLEGMQCP
jgi:hypothetical protein